MTAATITQGSVAGERNVLSRDPNTVHNLQGSSHSAARQLRVHFLSDSMKVTSQGRPYLGQDVGGLHLVDAVWSYFHRWVAIRLRYKVVRRCPIAIVDAAQMSITGAVGTFCASSDGSRQILISRKIVHDVDSMLIVLAHEYVHYLHCTIVGIDGYRNCPLVLREGLAEVGAREFCLAHKYRLPLEMSNSWDRNYDLARRIVSQIASESHGLDGFFRIFLMNVSPDSPWAALDWMFLRP